MKIAIINSFYKPDTVGGAEVIVQEQAQHLYDRGYEVFVACTSDVSSVEKEAVDGITVYRIPHSNVYWGKEHAVHSTSEKVRWHMKDRYNAVAAGYLKSIIEQERPQVAICHNLSGLSVAVWDVLHSYGVKVVQYLHDQYLACLKTTCFDGNRYCVNPCISCKIMRLKAKKMSSGIDGVVGVSRYIVDRFVSLGYFKGVKQKVIHNARFLSDPAPHVFSVQKLSIGYIGRVIESKGVDVLIRAFLKSGVDARLLIAGECDDPVYESRLNELCGGAQSIEFLGPVDSRNFYNRVDIVVVPSIWPDTFPTVAFESCAAGVPVIASEIGGLSEIIKDSVNGKLFTPGDVEQLSGILWECDQNRETLQRWSSECRGSVTEMTNVDGMVDKLITFINDIR